MIKIRNGVLDIRETQYLRASLGSASQGSHSRDPKKTASLFFLRDIFERVIHLSLAPKRMKFFFKRYLDYEKQHGTEKDVQAVKAKALEYVEAKSSALED